LIQTIWSLASFYLQSEVIGQLYIHNDGSLTSHDQASLKKYFPNAKIIDTNLFLSQYSSQLNNYPIIKEFRQMNKYVLLKKLIDQYFISDKPYRLFIDTDLVWYNQPIEIEDEIKNGCQNSFVSQNHNTHPNYTIHYKDGSKLEEKYAMINSGIVLYKKENFNLKKLENFLLKVDKENDLNNHFVEQAGFAYCLENLKILPYDKYTIKDKLSDRVVVKHYTGPRRLLFYIEGVETLKHKIIKT